MKDSDKRIYTLSEERPVKAVIKMGLPLVAGMLIMVMYNLVDTYFIGKTGDPYMIAAVNLSYPVMMVMISISNIIGTGSSSYITRSLGASDNKTAVDTLTSGFILTFINGLLVCLAGLLFLDPIVRGLGARENTFIFTRQYVEIILIGSLFTMGSYTVGAFLRSEGSVKFSMIGMITGPVVNMILDPIFIFTLKMNVRGAAIATVLGNVAGVAVFMLFYLCKATLLRPSFRNFRFNREIVREIYVVGLPASLETFLTSVAYVVNNNLAVMYGELTVAAMGIAQKVLSFGSYLYQGMASGIQPLMGYNYGARNFGRMKKILKAGVQVVTVSELVLMAAYVFFASDLIGIFTDSGEVIRIGAHVLRMQIFILPFVGSVSMSRMSFQAMGKPGLAFLITLIRQVFLYIPLLLVLNRLFGFNGLLCAQPVTEAVMMTVSLMLLVHYINKVSEED